MRCIELHGLDGMAGDETVLTDHEREADVGVLGDAGGHDEVVVGLLVVLAVELDPAGVAGAHRVAVVAMDVDGAGERAVDERHQHRLSHGSGDIEQLPHVGHAGGAGGGHHAAAGGAGADAGAHRGVLGLDGDELGVDLAVGDEGREVLDDLRRGGDRESGDNVGVDLAHGLQQAPAPVIGTILGFPAVLFVMASDLVADKSQSHDLPSLLTGHSWTQRPQPLQW